MNVTHSDIEITYVEDDNRWHFELRGRKRSAESLVKAKEAIDKEPAEKRKQVFPRFEAYLFKSYTTEAEIVTVTGIGDEAWRAQPQFWVVNKSGKRSKEYASSLFPVNTNNTEIIVEITRFDNEIEKLQQLQNKKREKLQVATVPKELQ